MEIAFSLSPRIITKKYELWAAALDAKISAINVLLEKWFRVGLRFLPLLPVENFQQIYTDFLDEITTKVDINKVSSTAITPLIFNQWDYNVITKKYKNDSDFSFVNNLQQNEHQLRTCSDNEISAFKKLFSDNFNTKKIFRDYI